MKYSDDLEQWLTLYHCAGIGIKKFRNYLDSDFRLVNFPVDIATDKEGIQRDLNWLATTKHAHILTLADERYPVALKNIYNAPPILYVLGNVQCLIKSQLAIVGSRSASRAGLVHAESFAKEFADLGIVITSGLAIGVDAASHRGALSTKHGETIAVLGNGLDQVYPERHKDLAAQIIEHGCLVSEFPIGVAAVPGHFPQRNRIISGLSLGVLVIEAADNSGSLITARYAMEQNREVFAVPGSIDTPKMRGCNQLIRDGAKLVESTWDVVEELASLFKYAIGDKKAGSTQQQITNQLSATHQQLLEFIDYDSTCVDEIVNRTGLASSAVGAILFELELSGLIAAVPGGYARTLD